VKYPCAVIDIFQIGYPVLTVTETPNGITVRQDRFLETGDATEQENETIWSVILLLVFFIQLTVQSDFRHVPLQLRTTDAAGKSTVDKNLILREREAQFPLDTSKVWKLNADTKGVCELDHLTGCGFSNIHAFGDLPDRVAYSPERWVKIAAEIARPGTSFTTEDRMGLVMDVFALARASYGKTSSALELLAGLRNETEG
jgi:aminopeptidase 2